MNRIVFFIALMLCCFTSSMAQSNDEHLTFKGVPIDGPLNEYVQKMELAGFSHIDTKNGTSLLKGDFAGCKNCRIVVSTNSNIVNTIAVIFPEKDDWSSLESNYTQLKEMLIEKYGQPTNCIEEFQGYRSPYDNTDKFLRLKTDKCRYVTFFETTKGNIILSLGHDEDGCFVMLGYIDRINSELERAQAMDDL